MAYLKNSWSASSGARADTIAVTVSGITENSLVLATIALDSADTLSSSNGFTLIADVPNGSATAVSLWGKVAGASEPSTYTWTTVGGAKTELAAGVFEIVGAKTDGATMADNVIYATATSTNSANNAGDVTTGVLDGDFALVTIGTDAQVTVNTEIPGHTQWASNPLYGDNDCTLLVQFLDTYTASAGYYPGSTYFNISTESSSISAVVHRGPGVLNDTAPLALTANTFGVLSGIVSTVDDFRFREDDSGETDATWLEPLNTDTTAPRDDPIRLRYAINSIVGDNASRSYNLEYLKTGKVKGAVTWRSSQGINSSYFLGRKTAISEDTLWYAVSYEGYSSSSNRIGIVYNSHAQVQGLAHGSYLGKYGLGISNDGNVLVAVDSYANGSGACGVRTWDWGTVWTERPNILLLNSDPSDLSISGDAGTLAVTDAYYIYTYRWNSGTEVWDLYEQINNGTDTTYGVDLNHDGDKLVYISTDYWPYGRVVTCEDNGTSWDRLDMDPIEEPTNFGTNSVAFLEDELLVVSSGSTMYAYRWNSVGPSWDLASDAITESTGNCNGISLGKEADGSYEIWSGEPLYDGTKTDTGRYLTWKLEDDWHSVGASSTTVENIVFYDSVNITQGEATTQQISSGTFDAGKVTESDPIAITHTGPYVTEVEFVITAPTANSNVNGTSFLFRVTGTNVTDNTTPTLTLGGVSTRIVLFNSKELVLKTFGFNRGAPVVIGYQGFKDDGGIGVHTPLGFPNTPWLQSDSDVFHVSLLIHNASGVAGTFQFIWSYSTDGGSTWQDAGKYTTDGLSSTYTDYWNNLSPYTRVLSSTTCTGGTAAYTFENSNLISSTTIQPGECLELTNNYEIFAEHMPPGAEVLIGIREITYGDHSNLVPAKFTRFPTVALNTATMDMSVTQPAITNLPVIGTPATLTLNTLPFSIPMQYKQAAYSGGYECTNQSYERAGTLTNDLNRTRISFLIYSDGIPNGIYTRAFRLQLRTDGGTWVTIPSIASSSGTTFDGCMKSIAQFDDDVYGGYNNYDFMEIAMKDGIPITKQDDNIYIVNQSTLGYVRPSAAYTTQAAEIEYRGITFGTLSADGTEWEFRLFDLSTSAELPGSAPYMKITMDSSLADTVYRKTTTRFHMPTYRSLGFEGSKFAPYRPVVHLTHFRGKYDVGGETDTSWIAALDTTWQHAMDYPLRLRLGFETTTYEDPQSTVGKYQLQHRIQGTDIDNWVEGTYEHNGGYYEPYNMDLTSDGITALVYGQPLADDTYQNEGLVTIYTKLSGSWEDHDPLNLKPPYPELGGRFGQSVSITDDGLTLIVGSPQATPELLPYAGSVYTFDLVDGAWVARQVLYGKHEEAAFGSDVHITGDGQRLIVNAQGRSFSDNDRFIYTYKLVSNEWQEEIPTINTGRGDPPYSSMCCNKVGTVLATYNDRTYNLGSVLVYKFTETGWVKIQEIYEDSTPEHDKYKRPIAFSNTGDVLICHADQGSPDRAHIFDYVDGAYQYRSWFSTPSQMLSMTTTHRADLLYFVTSAANLTPITNSYKGRWEDVGELGTTDTPVSIYDSTYIVDGEVTTQQITTSPNYNGGEISEKGISTFTSSSSVNNTEAEIVYPLTINSTGANPAVLDDEIEFRIFDAYDLDLPETQIPIAITVDQPAVKFITTSFNLNTLNFPTPIEFNTESLGTFTSLYFENGFVYIEPFQSTALTLASDIYKANHGIQFQTMNMTLVSAGRPTIKPTEAIISLRDVRGRDDDNYEASAAWHTRLNTSWGQGYDDPFRVRFVLENSILSDPNQTHNYKSQYNLNSAGTFNIVGGPLLRSTGDAEDSLFGRDVSISGDENVLAVSSPEYGDTYTRQGRVHIYDRVDDTWVYRDYIDSPSVGTNRFFGQGLALNYIGNIIYIGDPYIDDLYTADGVVREFTYNEGTWSLTETIQTDIVLNDNAHFGWALAVSKDSRKLFVGIPGYTYSGQINNGAFEIFYKGINWVPQGAYLISSAGAKVGSALACSNDGTHVCIGLPGYEPAGIIMFYDLIVDTWTFRPTAVGGTNVGEDFGSSLSCNQTGRVTLTGAPSFSGAEGSQGRVYIIDWNGDLDSPVYINRQAINNPTPVSADRFGSGVAMSETTDLCHIGIEGYTNNYNNQGGVYTLVPTYTWYDISGGAQVINNYNSSWITDGESTTQQLSSEGFEGGTVEETGLAPVTWTTEGVAEVEYVYKLDSTIAIETDIIKLRLLESTNSTVPSSFENIAQLEVFPFSVDNALMTLATSTSISISATIAKTAVMHLSTTTVMDAAGINEKSGSMHLVSDSAMTTVGSYLLEGNLTVSTTTVFYGQGTTAVEGVMHLSTTMIMNAIAAELGAQNGQMSVSTTSTWAGAGNINRNANMDLATTTTITLPSEVIHPASMDLSTTTTTVMSGVIVHTGVLTVATTTVMTSAGAVLLGPATCHMRTGTWFEGNLTYVPFHYGKARWNCTTRVVGQPSAIFAGRANLTSNSTMTSFGRLVVPGTLHMNTTTVLSTIGTFIRSGSMHLQSKAIASFNGSLIHPAKASWYTQSTLEGSGGLTFDAKCVIIGASSISLIAQNLKNANSSYVTTTTFNTAGTVIRNASTDLATSTILSATGTLTRGTNLSLASYTYWNAEGTVIEGCTEPYTNIETLINNTSVTEQSNITDVTCGE